MLSSAAMMDDVVGLVMVQVISNLGGGEKFEVVSVVRPLAVSFGLGIAVPVVCRFVVKPVTGWVDGMRKARPGGNVDRWCKGDYMPFLVHTVVLLGMVTGATYAGTSNLFAAYLAGAAVSWWDSEVSHVEGVEENSPPGTEQSESVAGKSPAEGGGDSSPEAEINQTEVARNEPHESSGVAVYHKYYATAVQRILKPFFFVSNNLRCV